VLIPRHSKVYGRVISDAQTGTELHEKICFTKNLFPANRIESAFLSAKCFGTEFLEFASIFFHGTEFRVVSLPQNGLERNSKCLLLFLFYGTEFRVVFSSEEWFTTEFPRVFLLFLFLYRISNIFLLCGMV
jgi:hypothetical protein